MPLHILLGVIALICLAFCIFLIFYKEAGGALARSHPLTLYYVFFANYILAFACLAAVWFPARPVLAASLATGLSAAAIALQTWRLARRHRG